MGEVVCGGLCCTVCVTGGSGFVASSLIKKLLANGHTVHATLRNLNDEFKVGLLKSLPNAATNLVVFKADIYEADDDGGFEAAIRGCQFVFHVASPSQHTNGSQYENRTIASIECIKKIAKLCVESGTVRRLIYTASVVSMSPMKHDGTGFNEFIDETCWTPLHLSYPFSNIHFKEYMKMKSLTEKEVLEFGESEESGGLEVVSLGCGLITGDTLHSYAAETTIVAFSQFTDQTPAFYALRFLEELIGKVPLVHLDDVCEAHIFCMQQSSIHGRFLCATSLLSSAEIAQYYRLHHPQLQQKHGGCCCCNNDEVGGRNIKMKSEKLSERGFVYKYKNGDMILEDAYQCYNNKNMFVNSLKLPTLIINNFSA